MATDVRVDPDVSTMRIEGTEVRVLSLLLGGVPRGGVAVLADPDGPGHGAAVETMNALAEHGYESVLADAAGGSGRAVLAGLLARLAERGWEDEQIGIIGHGRGARPVLETAAERVLGAAISLPRDHEELLDPAPDTHLTTPWLGLVGLGHRRAVSTQLAAFGEELRTAAAEHTSLVGFPGAQDCLRDSADPLEHAAAFDGWQRTAEWLNIHVAPRPTPLALAWRERRESLQPTS